MNSNLRSGLLVCKGLELDGLDAHLGCSVYQLERKQKCMKSIERIRRGGGDSGVKEMKHPFSKRHGN
jgi:hypothetical protein